MHVALTKEALRHAAKTDANQAEILKALRSIGISVEYIKLPVDLLVCDQQGKTALMEVKMPGAPLTKDQVEFIARWPGTVHIVHSPEEAVAAVVGAEAMK
jgi:hypothetical protein